MSYFSGSTTDYLEFSTNPLSIPFTEILRTQSFNVAIVDDSDFEPTEDFTVNLTVVNVVNFDASRVVVDPDLATITITDDDSKCMQPVCDVHVCTHKSNHFSPTDITVIVDSPELGPPDYTVPEDIETFPICLDITQPPSDVQLAEVFNIMVTTADGTAGIVYITHVCVSVPGIRVGAVGYQLLESLS